MVRKIGQKKGKKEWNILEGIDTEQSNELGGYD